MRKRGPKKVPGNQRHKKYSLVPTQLWIVFEWARPQTGRVGSEVAYRRESRALNTELTLQPRSETKEEAGEKKARAARGHPKSSQWSAVKKLCF